MKHTKLFLSSAAILLLAILITNVQASQKTTAKIKPSEAVQRISTTEPTITPTPVEKAREEPTVSPSVVPTPAPIPVTTPQPYSAVAEYGCGPADPKVVYGMLITLGMPRISALQQLGSWKSESHLDPCQKLGDNGLAWGLNSWHPGRRYDMPQGLAAQVNWAINVEMKRDCASCYEQLMDAASVEEARSAIQRSTRWGDPGARWLYADQFSNQL